MNLESVLQKLDEQINYCKSRIDEYSEKIVKNRDDERRIKCYSQNRTVFYMKYEALCDFRDSIKIT